MIIETVICLSRKQTEILPNSTVNDLLEAYGSSAFVLYNGRPVDRGIKLEDGKTYHIVPRVLGGKGGFGSMLRAIGAQIEKTTSREACRDLSGRRMRDINNEKKLKEWVAKEAEREQEKEERRKNRLERHLRPQHKFDDAEYHEQRTKVQEDLQDALSTGLKRKLTNGETRSTSKLKVSKTETKATKAEWLGVDLDSDDLDSGDSDTEAKPDDPGPSSINGSNNEECASSSLCRSEMGTTIPVKQLGGDNIKQEITSMACSSFTDSELDSTNRISSIDEENMKSMNGNCITQNKDNEETNKSVSSDTPVDLTEFNSSSELQELGMDRLKNALIARSLKCGGTLQERVARLWMVRGLSHAEIQVSHPALLAKGGGGKGGKGKKPK